MAHRNTVEFKVNGDSVSVAAAPDAPLIYVLRNDLKLTGTRFGCGDGLCGACTVLIDGNASCSCDTTIEQVAGKTVQTIESLTAEPHHPVITALLDHRAWQCGYCIAGITMQALALYNQVQCHSRKPMSRKEIAAALDLNLCRCGAHPRILDALESVLSDYAATQS